MPEFEPQKLASLTSGGETITDIYHATLDGRLPHTELLLAVVSSEADGVKAVNNGLPIRIIRLVDPTGLSQDDYAEELTKTVDPVNPTVIGQYGHDHFTPPPFLDHFRNQGVTSINQHFGHPKYFGGPRMSNPKRGHAAHLMVYRYLGVTETQPITVISQEVGYTFDSGDVMREGRVFIRPEDSVDSLLQRAKTKELQVQVATLQDLEIGRLVSKPPRIIPIFEENADLLEAARTIAFCLYNRYGVLRTNPDFTPVFKLGNHITQEYIDGLLAHLEPK